MTVKSKKKEEKVKDQPEVDELAQALEKADTYLSMAQRLQADFDNYRKRNERDIADSRKYANQGLISDLLTLVDDLERALANTEEDTEFVRGIKGIQQNLNKTLGTYGLEEIPTDCKFNTDLHEALCVQEADTDGDIAQVIQKGYRIHDRVLRYAKVIVTKKTEQPKTIDEENTGEQKCQE